MIFVWIIIAAIFVVGLVIAGVTAMMHSVLASLVTPNGHRRYGHYQDSDGYKDLNSESYKVTPDWSSNAIEKVRKS